MSMDKRRRHSLEVEDELAELGEDEDAYIEAERERRDERFRRDVDRHIFGRGGKLKMQILRARVSMPPRGIEPTSRYSPHTPLKKEVPFGKDDRTQNEKYSDVLSMETEEMRRTRPGYKIRPPKPTQKDRARIIQASIKQTLEFNADEFLANNFHKADRMVGHGLFIHPNGDLIEGNDPDNHTHYGAVRTYGPKAGLKLRSPHVEEEDIHDFLKKTGTVRLNNSLGVAHLQVATRLTQPQIKAIKDYEKAFGDLQYGIGETVDDMVMDTGVMSLLRHHANIFGQKHAQEDDNVNMTYTKSKKVKLLKEMFRDQRTAKAADSIALFKQQKLGPEHEEGFGFDPRHNDFVTPQTARERYGKPGVALHFIATTDNPGPVENISSALDAIGDNHFIGGWKSSTGFKTDASYIINTNDQQEVIFHLKRHNQEASYSVDPSGNPYFIRNPDFVKH